MEYSNHNEESINSSEEVDQQQQENNHDLGVGRCYECVFCKRGFNTAQALGGHMNIHRKDRARNKPITSNNNSNNISSSKQLEESYINYSTGGPRFYQQVPAAAAASGNYVNIQSRNDHFSCDHPLYATCFPSGSNTSGTINAPVPLYGNYHHQQYRTDHDDFNPDREQTTNDPLIPGDWRMILEDLEKNKQVMNQKEELDLELRLGYDS